MSGQAKLSLLLLGFDLYPYSRLVRQVLGVRAAVRMVKIKLPLIPNEPMTAILHDLVPALSLAITFSPALLAKHHPYP